MKTKHFLFGTLAAMLMFTSCQDDTALMGNESEVMVSFNLETPQIATRAFSDGSVANLLQYAVYDQNGNQLTTHSGTVSNFTGSATINLKLSSGNTYSAIFWAANENAPYIVDFEDKTMTVNYEGALSNDETRDAFYKYQEFTVEGNQTVSVELKRPFAQLNIGTNDFAEATAASYAPTQSAVTVMEIANILDLCDGTVSGEQDVTFAYNKIPAATETFPVDGYQYLAMNYVLVGKDKEVFDIVYKYRDNNNLEQKKTVGSVPMQRNYRTNIYGSLLTNDLKVEVDMEPDYEGPAYEADPLQLAAAIGGEVTLSENVVLTKPLEVQNNLIINLNGKTISTTDASGYVIYNTNGSTLRITDTNNGVVNGVIYNEKSTAIIDGGTYNAADGGKYVFLNTGGSLTINGGTINGGSGYPVYSYDANHKLVINDVTVNGTFGCINAYTAGGEVEINGGTFTASFVQGTSSHIAYFSNVDATINGGTFKKIGNVNMSAAGGGGVCVIYGANLTVNAGEFAGDYADIYDWGGTNANGRANTISLLGGTYKHQPTAGFIADGYKAVENGENWIVVEDNIDNVTTVGTAEDLMNALNSLVAGNMVVLEQDIDLTGEAWSVSMPWQGSATDVVFDGNGHKITGLSTNGLQGGLLGKFNSNGNITIKNLTLADVTMNGTDVDGESAGGALIGWIENHGAGTITIENVHVEGIKAEGFKYIGGLIGYNNGNVAMNVTGCSVVGKVDSYLNSTYNESGNYKGHIGGLLGLWNKGSLTNCEVKDLTIKHGTNDMTGSSNRAGALVGTKYAGVEVVSATVDNVTVDGVAATAASLFGPAASSASASDKSNVTIK